MQPIVMAKLKQIIVPFIAGAIGLFFYITRFPEKVFKAGSVDIVGASHQVIPAYVFLFNPIYRLSVDHQHKLCYC